MSGAELIIPAAASARVTYVEAVGTNPGFSIYTDRVIAWRRNERGGFLPLAESVDLDDVWLWTAWSTDDTTELDVVRGALRDIADSFGSSRYSDDAMGQAAAVLNAERDAEFQKMAEFAEAMLGALPGPPFTPLV